VTLGSRTKIASSATPNSLKTEEEIQTIRFKFTSFASMDLNIQHGGVPRRSRFFYRGSHFDFGPFEGGFMQ
jgi:hypothetical protein